jgi:hypothetical protein
MVSAVQEVTTKGRKDGESMLPFGKDTGKELR